MTTPGVAAAGVDRPELAPQGERRVGRRVVLHVDPDERLVLGGPAEDPLDVRRGSRRVDAEAHLAQLDADVAIEAAGRERVEDREVLVGRRAAASAVDATASPRTSTVVRRPASRSRSSAASASSSVSPATNRATIERVTGSRVASRPRDRRRDSHRRNERRARSGAARRAVVAGTARW